MLYNNVLQKHGREPRAESNKTFKAAIRKSAFTNNNHILNLHGYKKHRNVSWLPMS